MSDLTAWLHIAFTFRNATDDFHENTLEVCVLVSSSGKLSFKI